MCLVPCFLSFYKAPSLPSFALLFAFASFCSFFVTRQSRASPSPQPKSALKVLPLSKSRSSPKKKKKIQFLKLCFLLRSSLHSPRNFCLPFWSWSFVLFFVFFSPSELKFVFSALIFVGANLLRNFLLPVALLLHEFKFPCKFCFGKYLYQYSSSASKLHQIWWQ